MKRALAILLFAALLYTPFLLRTIRLDEAVTWRLYTRDLGTALLDWSMPNNHKTYSVLVWMTRVLWPALLALRLPAFFFTLLSIALLYRLAGEAWGRQAGAVAALLWATNPVIAEYAVNGRGYSLTLMLMLLWLWSKRARSTGILAFGLVLTIPTNALILIAKPRRAAFVGATLAGLFYLPALFNGQARANLARFGSSPADFIGEFSLALHGTGAIVCLIFVGQIWYGLWRRRSRLSRFKWRSANSSTPGISFFSSSRFAVMLATCCALIALYNLPLTLGQPTEADVAMQIINPLYRAGDGILAGCCVDDPLRFYFSDAYDRIDSETLFIVPSTYGIFNLEGCDNLTSGVYRCNR